MDSGWRISGEITGQQCVAVLIAHRRLAQQMGLLMGKLPRGDRDVRDLGLQRGVEDQAAVELVAACIGLTGHMFKKTADG